MGGGPGRRALLAGAALIGLGAIVGLASRASTPGSGGGQTRTVSGDILLEYAVLLTGVAALIMLPVVAHAILGERKSGRGWGLPQRRNWMLSLFLTMAALAIALGIFLATGVLGGGKKSATGNSGLPNESPLAKLANRSVQGKPVRFDWLPVIVVFSLATVGGGAAALFLRRRREDEPRPATVAAETVAAALDESLDDLLAEPDPRRAVIAAYARMEQALERAGLPRRPSDAPHEYLERALQELGARAASIERLTMLFERAKFSVHEIDRQMKEDAITALVTLRDELRGQI
jgi:hypothetical protein